MSQRTVRIRTPIWDGLGAIALVACLVVAAARASVALPSSSARIGVKQHSVARTAEIEELGILQVARHNRQRRRRGSGTACTDQR